MDAEPLVMAFLLFGLMPIVVAIGGALYLVGGGNRLIMMLFIPVIWLILTWLCSLSASRQITLWTFIQPWLVTVMLCIAAYVFGRMRRGRGRAGKRDTSAIGLRDTQER